MRRNILVICLIFVCKALANSKHTPSKGRMEFLPRIAGGIWKKNKKIAVMPTAEEYDAPILKEPFLNNIIAWLKLEAQSPPISNKVILARRRISGSISLWSFPLSLVNLMQKVFGTSAQTTFTSILNSLLPDILLHFIKRDPCTYEKLVSLSNYKKLNIGAISVIVTYLRDAPAASICTSKLRNRLKEFFTTHYQIAIRDYELPAIKTVELLKAPTQEVMTILKSKTLFALYLPMDVQLLAIYILANGTASEIFELMSLNLPSHDIQTVIAGYGFYSYCYAGNNTYGAYEGWVPPFVDDPVVTEFDKNYKYGPKLLALRNHNWGTLNCSNIWDVMNVQNYSIMLKNERWKRLYYRRKAEKESGKVTFYTLEEDYNSIILGTATPELTSAFCSDIKTLSDDTAEFWNLKFRRNVLVKDADLGVCPENDKAMKDAIYDLRLAAHYNRSISCSAFRLVERLPELSWFISLKELKPSVFVRLFKCGLTPEKLIEMNKYTYVLEQKHENLALGIKKYYRRITVKDPEEFPYPSIIRFFKLKAY